MSAPVLLEAKGLVKRFHSRSLLRKSEPVCALDHIDLKVYEGEVLAVIGESGSGKTTLGKALLRLMSLDEGQVLFGGEDLFALDRRSLRLRRRQMQMVFQNQRANLHPKMTVGQMLDESIRLHQPDLSAAQREPVLRDLLARVGLEQKLDQRPESLSGGERRRVGLARILATRPRLIIADEPTSGLDAAIKLQIIGLLRTLKEEQLTYILISHDLGLVRHIADRVIVMLKGRIIEDVPAARLGQPGHHPYTERLFRAANLDSLDPQRDLADSSAQLDALLNTHDAERRGGCVYADVCALARERGILQQCRSARPPLVQINDQQRVACFAAEAAPPRESAEQEAH